MKSSTAKTNFISKTSRVVVFALLFVLALSVCLSVLLQTSSSDLSFAANAYYADYNSGLTVKNGSVGTVITSLSATHTNDSGAVYTYLKLSSNVGWEGDNKTYYYGWYITFSGSAYYAIINGAVGDIHNKLSLTGDGTADGKKYHVHSNKPSSNGDTTTVENGGTYFSLSAEKKGGTSNTHPMTADLTLTAARLAQYGINDGTNHRITYYNELGLFGGTGFRDGLGAGDVDTYVTSDGIWLDIYITDTTAPTMSHTSGSTSFSFSDASAGIQKVLVSRNGGSEVDITSQLSLTEDTRDATWTANEGGVYKIKVVDNVGNSIERYEYVEKFGTKTASPFDLTCREDFNTLAYALSGLGRSSAWVSDGFANDTFNVVPDTSKNSQNATTINMQSTVFTAIGTESSQFKGSIIFD